MRQDKSLGDVARKQPAVHAQQKKATSVHTDIAHSSSAAESSDRRLGEKPDPYVVPAGTEIRVDLTESKITGPVRLGFATPIPALTKVAVDTDRAYLQNNYRTYPRDGPDYIEYATVTAITIDGKTYEVRTNRVQVSGGG